MVFHKIVLHLLNFQLLKLQTFYMNKMNLLSTLSDKAHTALITFVLYILSDLEYRPDYVFRKYCVYYVVRILQVNMQVLNHIFNNLF